MILKESCPPYDDYVIQDAFWLCYIKASFMSAMVGEEEYWRILHGLLIALDQKW